MSSSFPHPVICGQLPHCTLTLAAGVGESPWCVLVCPRVNMSTGRSTDVGTRGADGASPPSPQAPFTLLMALQTRHHTGALRGKRLCPCEAWPHSRTGTSSCPVSLAVCLQLLPPPCPQHRVPFPPAKSHVYKPCLLALSPVVASLE